MTLSDGKQPKVSDNAVCYSPADNKIAALEAEVERLRALFLQDGEANGRVVRNMTERHEARIARYARRVDELRVEAAQARSLALSEAIDVVQRVRNDALFYLSDRDALWRGGVVWACEAIMANIQAGVAGDGV